MSFQHLSMEFLDPPLLLDQQEGLCSTIAMSQITSTSTDIFPMRFSLQNTGRIPHIDFRNQCAILDLDSLARESFHSNLPTDDDIHFKVKNPRYYPIGYRSNVLDDFQTLVENDLKELHQHNVTHKKRYKNLSPSNSRQVMNLRKILVWSLDSQIKGVPL